MKIFSKAILLILVFALLTSLCYADPAIVDVNASAKDGVGQEIIPMYEPHDCHTGPLHQNCKEDIMVKSCGCMTVYERCCCGKLMDITQFYCDIHP